ncbi:Unknown protein [Striga hermonthica]|uniref:Reverse transcriptase domain-containing protein n=1 Tax=Striga hermonthica TaxID=68872 RepID=A0A9N7RN53_STRHE|nr:Unknown protein [Striga hermonthica]
MIDGTTGHEGLSFKDGSSGYNQIRMSPKDEELTEFRTPKGIYCYKVMPFGLNNARATYQRAMQKIFEDILHKNIECYVEDVVRYEGSTIVPSSGLKTEKKRGSVLMNGLSAKETPGCCSCVDVRLSKRPAVRRATTDGHPEHYY